MAATSVWETGGEEDASPLEEIAGAEIKFLLAGEARRLALVDAHARLLPVLAHSVLRDASFSQVQARISQGLRMNRSDMQALFTNMPEVRYDDEAAAFEKLLLHLEGLIDAAAFVLVGGDSVDDGDNLRRLNFEALARGRRALMGLRRRGFDELRAGAPDAVEALRRTVPAIVELRDRLAPLCARLRRGGAVVAASGRGRARVPRTVYPHIPHDGAGGTGDGAMSRWWSMIQEAERAAMGRRFASGLAVDELAIGEAPAEPDERPLRFDELYAAAENPVAALGETLAARLAADAASRATFEAVLRDRAVCWFPAAAAASNGELGHARGGRLPYLDSSVKRRWRPGVCSDPRRGRPRRNAGRAGRASSRRPAGAGSPAGGYRRGLSVDRTRGFGAGACDPQFPPPNLPFARGHAGDARSGPYCDDRGDRPWYSVLAVEEGLAEAELSAVCLNGTTTRLPITGAYTYFVRDHLRTLSGRAAYRLDLDRRVDGGSSWMLGAWIAHLLLAEGRLAMSDETAEIAVFATGEVAFSADAERRDEVRAVGHVSEKIERLADAAAEEAAAGRRVLLIVPRGNVDEAKAAHARLPVSVRHRIAFHAVTEIGDVRALLASRGAGRCIDQGTQEPPPVAAVRGSTGRLRCRRRCAGRLFRLAERRARLDGALAGRPLSGSRPLPRRVLPYPWPPSASAIRWRRQRRRRPSHSRWRRSGRRTADHAQDCASGAAA